VRAHERTGRPQSNRVSALRPISAGDQRVKARVHSRSPLNGQKLRQQAVLEDSEPKGDLPQA
jgi:hypothetical protein